MRAGRWPCLESSWHPPLAGIDRHLLAHPVATSGLATDRRTSAWISRDLDPLAWAQSPWLRRSSSTPAAATLHLIRHQVRVGRAGAGFWTDLAIVVAAIFLTLAAHLVEIAVWALLFMVCGEFPAFAMACYHSAVNYTTLGYGDVVMTASWKFLGPLEAANGLLLFGVSTALVFAVIQRVAQARFADLRA